MQVLAAFKSAEAYTSTYPPISAMPPGRVKSGGDRFLGVLRDSAQKDGLLALTESLPQPTESVDGSAVDSTRTQFKWLHANTKASRMTVREHLKASEVRGVMYTESFGCTSPTGTRSCATDIVTSTRHLCWSGLGSIADQD